MEFFLIWLAFAVVTAIVASGKGRSGFGWLLLGAFFGIFALIVVACLPSIKPPPQVIIMKDAPGPEPHAVAVPTDTKTCPKCAETIKAAAVVCRFCGQYTAETQAEPVAPPMVEPSAPSAPAPSSGVMRGSAALKSSETPWTAVAIVLGLLTLVAVVTAWQRADSIGPMTPAERRNVGG